MNCGSTSLTVHLWRLAEQIFRLCTDSLLSYLLSFIPHTTFVHKDPKWLSSIGFYFLL